MKLLTFDPGESTGYATFDVDEKPTGRYELLDAGTADLEVVQFSLAAALGVPLTDYYGDAAHGELIEKWVGVEHVAFEDFVIYPHKAQELIGDYVRTARLIGVIEFLATAADIPYTPQLAREAKSPAEAAGAEELFLSPLHENRHANDAIRHGVYWTLMRQFRARKAGAARG